MLYNAVITDSEKSHLADSDLVRYVLGVRRPDTAFLSIDAQQLPDIPEALDAVDTLVVIGDSLSQDAAATEAVQDWVRLGGTLWLLLDTMTNASAQVVCGGELLVQEIDRVSLISYSLLTNTNVKRRKQMKSILSGRFNWFGLSRNRAKFLRRLMDGPPL